jgi:ABC-type dipeptide/oligopeptide/nickel transport system permease subunit
MTEPTTKTTGTDGGGEWGDAEADGTKHYSKDYWDIVFHQLSRHRLFKVGVAVLALMYGVAIYAPFLAGDRPFKITGVDTEEYGTALRLLSPVASSVRGLVLQSPQDYDANRSETSPPTLAEAIAVEREAAAIQLGILRTYAPDAAEAPFDDYEEALDAAIAAFESGNTEAAGEAVGEARSLARSLRTSHQGIVPPELLAARAAALGETVESGASDDEPTEGIVLEPHTTYPLWTNIAWWELGMMVLWAFVLTWPLWNALLNRVLLRGNREAIRNWRMRKLGIVLVVPLIAAVGWLFLTGGARDTFDASPLKSRLTAGTYLYVESPVFPLFPYGYSETHTDESFRPPTWTFKGKLDELGRPLDYEADADSGGMEGTFTPVEVRYGEPDRNSFWRHPAGVDGLGRDFVVRMIWGGRISLAVGILSALLLTVIGVVIGSVAGYFGGWIDVVIMRSIEIIQSIPAFFLILATMSFTDPDVIPPMFAIVIVIALIRWTGVARLVRGEFLRLREQEFVVAARALGFSSARTIFKHVLPNALSPVLVAAAFAVASGILTESAVSFLGFGIQAPKASWGSLVNVSRDPSHWWGQVFPGVLIFITVTCYNLVGDAVRDALDPKMKV